MTARHQDPARVHPPGIPTGDLASLRAPGPARVTRPAQVAAELGLWVNAVLIAKIRVLKRLPEQAARLVDF